MITEINLGQYYLRKKEIEEAFGTGNDDAAAIKAAIDAKPNLGTTAQTAAKGNHTHSNYLTSHNPVDNALLSDSTNAVENRAIYNALLEKSNNDHTHNYIPNNTDGSTTGSLTAKKFISSSNNNDKILLGNGNVISQSTFAENSHTHNYIPNNANGSTTGTLTAKKFINSSNNNDKILLGNGNVIPQSTFAENGHNHNSLYPQLNQIQYLNGSYYVNEGNIIQQKITITDGVVGPGEGYFRVSINDLQNNQKFYVEGIEYTIEERNDDNILIGFSDLSSGSYVSLVLSELKTNGYIYTGDRYSIGIE